MLRQTLTAQISIHNTVRAKGINENALNALKIFLQKWDYFYLNGECPLGRIVTSGTCC